MQLSYLLPPLLAFVVTVTALYAILKFFPKWGLMDRPHEYGIKRPSIPYSAGIIFYIVVFITTILFVDISKPILGLLCAGFLITVVSFIDDRIRLSPWLRLAVQFLAGLIVVIAGVKLQIISNPFQGTPLYLDTIKFSLFGSEIWLISGIFVIIWLMLMMNVMNWLDGIPGLASGTSTIAQITIFILATRQFNIIDQSAVITISGVLAAATCAFLFFDFFPPKILMGDTGSMFLGFMLGTLSIIAGGKIATALLIMGFPVIDALWVVLKRMLQGKSPLRGDYSHFHHRLLNIGLSERHALIFNYFLCALFGGIAVFLPSASTKFIAFVGVFILMIIVGIFMIRRSR